jgi:hypothetical protein
MTEADVSAKLRKALVSLGCVAWKVSDRFHASRPDLVACHNGRFIAIETKIYPNKPTTLQAFTLAELVAVCAIVYVVSYDKLSKALILTEVSTKDTTSFTDIRKAAQWVLRRSI